MSSPDDASLAPRTLKPQCLSIDLEVGRNSGVIHQLAALRGDTTASQVFPPGTLAQALDAVNQLADSTAFLLGHNLIAFDLPHLQAAQPNLRLLTKPVVDTLRLNPLAFPKNPYHHLVKHYQDGQLLGNRKNNPLLDAELALQIFCDQEQSMQALQAKNPDLLLAWHWLTTRDQSVSGLNSLFMTIRKQCAPEDEEAQAALARLGGSPPAERPPQSPLPRPRRTLGLWPTH